MGKKWHGKKMKFVHPTEPIQFSKVMVRDLLCAGATENYRQSAYFLAAGDRHIPE